jgi:hypothetical protein
MYVGMEVEEEVAVEFDKFPYSFTLFTFTGTTAKCATKVIALLRL